MPLCASWLGVWPLEIKSPYRNDRVSALIPIQVSWTGRRGENFNEPAQTLTVRRNAATILLGRKLLPHQEITIRCIGTGQSAPARVVGLIRQEAGEHIYGVAFLDPNANLWDMELPSVGEGQNARSSFFLECASCLTRAQVNLDDIQTEVFESQRIITLSCKQCSSWTVWGLASLDSSSKSDGMGGLKSSPAPARTNSERSQTRPGSDEYECLRAPRRACGGSRASQGRIARRFSLRKSKLLRRRIVNHSGHALHPRRVKCLSCPRASSGDGNVPRVKNAMNMA